MIKRVELIVSGIAGDQDTYPETWEKTDYFCLCCGQPSVWMDLGGEDEDDILCIDCGATFVANSISVMDTHPWTRQRLTIIREKVNAS